MKRNNMFLIALGAALILGISALTLYSCSSSSSDTGTSKSSVALYLTDDMSLFTRVTATINKVQVLNTGSGATCDVLTTPVAVNIADLANVLQLVNIADCPAVSYNRIHIEFAQSVELMTAATPTATFCSFTSYKDETNHPNVLACSGTVCTLEINGAVNVLTGQTNKLALDFNLKDFDVENFGTPSACTVTMKVSPLHAGEMESKGHPESITGLISGLSTTNKSFTLKRGSSAFTVLYSGITATQQPGIDSLLQRAETDGLRAKVTSSGINVTTGTINASSVVVKVEGTVSALNTTDHTFTITYKGVKTLGVNYASASVHGTLANDVVLEVKLYGFDGVNYLAQKVDIGDDEGCIDN